jgi:glycosyltransferase involved in cell wall biosynthesis
LHILYLHQHFSPPDGIGNNRSLELALEWVKEGHEVTIVCGKGNFNNIRNSFAFYNTIDFSGIKVIRLNIGYSHFYSFPRRILSFLGYFCLVLLLSFRLKKADIVYASSTPLTVGLFGIWFKKVFRKKFIFETVDLWPDVPIEMDILKNKWLRYLTLKLEKNIYDQAETIVCLSEGMKERIEQKGMASEKIKVAHNGTNCSMFRPTSNKEEAKKSIGYSEKDFIVLYAGTIGLANGLEFLVDVASETKDPTIQFIILGNGNREHAIRKYAQKKQVNNLVFKDSVPKEQVKAFFDATDVGIVTFAPYPILATNSANKFFDYLASGLPVLINYGGWQKDYLKRHGCGISSMSATEMALHLLYLVEHPVNAIQMGINARKLAVERFDRKRIARTIAELF